MECGELETTPPHQMFYFVRELMTNKEKKVFAWIGMERPYGNGL